MPPFCAEDRANSELFNASGAAGAAMVLDWRGEVPEGDGSAGLKCGADTLPVFPACMLGVGA